MNVKDCNIVYHSLGQSDRSAMPLGNGELAASVWAQTDGIHLYLTRTDCLTETDRTVKLGELVLSTEPSFLAEGTFTQTLDLESGCIVLSNGKDSVKVFAYSEEDALYLCGTYSVPRVTRASWKCWRTEAVVPFGAQTQAKESADKLLTEDGRFYCYHVNGQTIIPETAELEAVGDVMECLPDALTGRIFGVCFAGDETPATSYCLKVMTRSEQESEASFLKSVTASLRSLPDAAVAETATASWWKQYWSRSYVEISGDPVQKNCVEDVILPFVQEPTEYTCACQSPVTVGYTLTKYMMTCCDRGRFPVLYNGMLFNLMPGNNEHFDTNSFGRCFTAQPGQADAMLNPDERSWCVEHLWQNLRHPYHSMLARGESENMKPLFRYMKRFEELNRVRAARYHKAQGQHNTEMTLSFGLQSVGIYGKDRKGKDVSCPFNRWGGTVEISPGLEYTLMMMDYVEFTGDRDFFLGQALPYAMDLLTYIATRFRNRRNGRIVLGPLHSIETYWDTVNPVTVTAGMQVVVEHLLASPFLPEKEKAELTAYAAMLPEVARERKPDGEIIAPAEAYAEERHNVEPPAMYTFFPYRMFGFDKPELEMAKRTFAEGLDFSGVYRPFHIGETPGSPSYSGWQYVGSSAAILGMRKECGEILSHNCALRNPGTRFPAMWGPIYDAVPDTDHGSNILTLLQLMLLQTNGKKIYLLPALPLDWNASFRLYADKDTVVEATYCNGKMEHLTVTPESRRADVIVMSK